MMSEPVAAASGGSWWEDLLDAFISPAELFRRRRDGRFGIALLILIMLIALVYFGTRSAMQPIYDVEFQRAMASRNMTPEELESARRVAAGFTPVLLLVGLPIGLLLLGGVVWLVARALGGRLSYAQGATIATFAYFPRVVDGISGGAQALLMDQGSLTSRYSVSLGIGRLLDAANTNQMALAMLGRLDLFTLWITVLIGVGLKQMAGITRAQAAAGAALVWLIGAIPALVQAFRAG